MLEHGSWLMLECRVFGHSYLINLIACVGPFSFLFLSKRCGWAPISPYPPFSFPGGHPSRGGESENAVAILEAKTTFADTGCCIIGGDHSAPSRRRIFWMRISTSRDPVEFSNFRLYCTVKRVRRWGPVRDITCLPQHLRVFLFLRLSL